MKNILWQWRTRFGAGFSLVVAMVGAVFGLMVNRLAAGQDDQ